MSCDVRSLQRTVKVRQVPNAQVSRQDRCTKRKYGNNYSVNLDHYKLHHRRTHLCFAVGHKQAAVTPQ